MNTCTSDLRTSPCFNSPCLEDYDVLLCSIFSNISNIRFENNQPPWLQATLPVNRGGGFNFGHLGTKSAVHHAPSAFLASADGSLALVHQILPLRLHNAPYHEKVEAHHQWGGTLDTGKLMTSSTVHWFLRRSRLNWSRQVC